MKDHKIMMWRVFTLVVALFAALSLTFAPVLAPNFRLAPVFAEDDDDDDDDDDNGVRLTKTDCERIVAAAVAQANIEVSIFRADAAAYAATTRMQIVCINREAKVLAFESMEDAWGGSIDIALAKANTARAFSSNENALTSRDVGFLSQPGFPLWQIGNSNQSKPVKGNAKFKRGKKVGGLIEFPGGIPLYKGNQATLVGAIGVSGDGVDQDEDVAEAGSCGFLPPENIRSDNAVLGGGVVPYTLGAGTQFDFRGIAPGVPTC